MECFKSKVTISSGIFFRIFLFSDALNTVIHFLCIMCFIFIAVSIFNIWRLIAVLVGFFREVFKKSRFKLRVVLKWLQLLFFVAIAYFILVFL